jgi:hypothetical protein
MSDEATVMMIMGGLRDKPRARHGVSKSSWGKRPQPRRRHVRPTERMVPCGVEMYLTDMSYYPARKTESSTGNYEALLLPLLDQTVQEEHHGPNR